MFYWATAGHTTEHVTAARHREVFANIVRYLSRSDKTGWMDYIRNLRQIPAL
jgi:hypothetical protein